jgi:2-polyprenyl-3-methyl-5-hydroxy-6-metoxy-1,4-benzoquinol methylase
LEAIIDIPPINSRLESETIEYTSIILQQLADRLEKQRRALVLDVGVVCNENINYFAQRAKKLFVCDIFAHMNRDQSSELKTNSVWHHLDYEPNSFDVINLWNLVEHLNDNDAKRLTEICSKIIKKKGLLFVIDIENHVSAQAVSSFAIGKDFQISLRPQTHLDFPWYYRHNRALISLFTSFSTIKIFQYRKGVREFLFQR